MVDYKNWQIGLAILTALGLGVIGLYAATPGPVTGMSLQDIPQRMDVLLGASVTEASAENIQVVDRNIQSTGLGGRVFGSFLEPGENINPGEEAQYCAEVLFTSEADYTYLGHYIESGDFNFQNEGETKWSQYYKSGTTHTVCNKFTAPGKGSYKMNMRCDFTSPVECDIIDSDTFQVEGEPDQPPTVDLDCPSTAKVGKSKTINGDADDDTGISDYNWDVEGFTGDGPEDDDITLTWDSTGSKDVKLTVKDQSGQTASDSCTVNIEKDQDPGVNLNVEFIQDAAAIFS